MFDAWKNLDEVDGFSPEKGAPDYWLTAVNAFWDETRLDTDDIELAVIVKWFDNYRKQLRES